MPDSQEPKGPLPTGNDLEQLVAEAETSKPEPCPHVAEANRHCPTCDYPFCPECASRLDATYCCLCLPVPDAELRSEPLIDSEGEIHEGRHLIPSGPAYSPPRFMSMLKSFNEMSLIEQEDYIQHYKNLVHQSEITLDYHRIVLGGAQLIHAEGQDAQRRKLRADKTKYAVKTVTLDPKTGKQKTTTASVTKLADMMKMLEALAKLKAQKSAGKEKP